MHSFWRLTPVALLASTILVSPSRVAAESEKSGTEAEDEAVIQYCLDISDKAAEARLALQSRELRALEERIDTKVAELDKLRSNVEGWIEKQKRLQESATSGLVEIYAAMDPEVAAKQMANLEPILASSVLRKLKPRSASSILDEMKPEQAAVLVRILATAIKREDTEN